MSFIFLSYAREDQDRANEVWNLLTYRGIQVWMDTARLLPGQRWDPIIRTAIGGSTGAVFLASRHSLAKGSYIQDELDALVHRAAEIPDDEIFLIVLRLDDFPITDERLLPFHWANFFGPDAAKEFSRIVDSSWKSAEYTERRKDREEIEASEEDQGKDRKTPYTPTRGTTEVLFLPEDLDIYVNKATKEAFIFHGKTISYDISHLVYVPENHRVIVVMNDGVRFDLGVRIQWLIRAYFTKASAVRIMRTKNRQAQEEITVPLKQGVLGTYGARVWPSLRGLTPLIVVGNAMASELSKEQKQELQRKKVPPSQDLFQEMQRAKVITDWLRWMFVGCLVLLVLALIGGGILIGRLL